jgi:hypothetical protein
MLPRQLSHRPEASPCCSKSSGPARLEVEGRARAHIGRGGHVGSRSPRRQWRDLRVGLTTWIVASLFASVRTRSLASCEWTHAVASAPSADWMTTALDEPLLEKVTRTSTDRASASRRRQSSRSMGPSHVARDGSDGGNDGQSFTTSGSPTTGGSGAGNCGNGSAVTARGARAAHALSKQTNITARAPGMTHLTIRCASSLDQSVTSQQFSVAPTFACASAPVVCESGEESRSSRVAPS